MISKNHTGRVKTGKRREVVGTSQTEEDTFHVCFDGVGDRFVRVGKTDVE